jgi:light-independent protochlorophyllide reductase subunit B
MPYVSTTPMGVVDTVECIQQIQKHVNKLTFFFLDRTFNYESYIDQQTKFVSQAAWFSRSIDCQNLTKKKAMVFDDATHATSMTKILAREMGIHVNCVGIYCKHDVEWFKE